MIPLNGLSILAAVTLAWTFVWARHRHVTRGDL